MSLFKELEELGYYRKSERNVGISNIAKWLRVWLVFLSKRCAFNSCFCLKKTKTLNFIFYILET